MITIFTDGASKGNPGPGGFAAIIASPEQVEEIGGGEAETTNNRMEMMAAISALSNKLVLSASPDATIALYTDSRYLINGSTKWIHGWKKNEWKGTNKKPILNQDLWQKIDSALSAILQHSGTITWHHVDGHSGIAANERVDEIAVAFAEGKVPELFSGSRAHYKIDLSPKVSNGSGAGGKSSESPEKRKLEKERKARSAKPAYSYISMVDGKIETHRTWKECEARVKGVSGAKFKKALTKEEETEITAKFS